MTSRVTQLTLGLTTLAASGLALAHGDHPDAAGISHSLLHAFGGWDNILAAFVAGLVAIIGIRILRRRR